MIAEGILGVREEVRVLDPRGAGALTVSTDQTVVQLVKQMDVNGSIAFGDGAHQMDAPSRARGLAARDLVGGAGAQAQTAMYAVEALGIVDDVSGGRVQSSRLGS